MRAERHEIVVVGGGIAGLYCGYRFARAGRPVVLCEAAERLGGRIESWRIDDELTAEFGPMRIEPESQPLLKGLLDDLDLKPQNARAKSPKPGDLVPFTEYAAKKPRGFKLKLRGEEGRQKDVFDLIRLGFRRIFERTQSLDLSDAARMHFERMLAPSAGGGTGQTWRRALDQLAAALTDEDFDKLRKSGTIDDQPLWDTGFWNALTDVLSHDAVIMIRDWGTFYHLLPENPNAAEWIIFWLRAFKTSKGLRTIKGGMDHIVLRLGERLIQPTLNELVSVRKRMKLVSLKPAAGDRVLLEFDCPEGRCQMEADHVILALPKRPLERLGDDLKQIGSDLDAVVGFPLVKCFFVVNRPWWEKEREANAYAGRVPTRELHYWRHPKARCGMIMVYTDRPGTAFWSAYLSPRWGEQHEAQKWDHRSDSSRNPRLEAKFVQYLRENRVSEQEFTAHDLLQYGIRDWSREPFGAACHAWRPGAKSWEVMPRLEAFSLTGKGKKTVHICGEAYSDYQGFIEGSLRSAENVLQKFGLPKA